jgi:plant 4,4-dimethylsterol C-4alpha-methyl-monooxygenase
LPGSIVFLSLDVHFFTFIFFSIFKIFLGQESHSGYYFPWSPLRIIPLFYDGTYHSFHHSVNTGNYATAFYVTEMLFGTNKTFLDSELAKIEAKKK